MNELFFVFNGQLLSGHLAIAPHHPALAYGYGLFETIRIHHGKPLNWDLHLARLQKGCDELGLQYDDSLRNQLLSGMELLLAQFDNALYFRLRISVLKSDHQPSDASEKYDADYLIQGMPVNRPTFHEQGSKLMIYRRSQKATGAISNLKNNNYLLHALALRKARGEGMDDVVILNSAGSVCETAVANIFFVEGESIFTPELAEGCVEGTIRSWLLQNCHRFGLNISTTKCSPGRLMKADEVFLTNAIKWIEPVRQIEQQTFGIRVAAGLFQILKNELTPGDL